MDNQLKQLKKQARREFRKRFKNPKNTGYRVGEEFLGAVELYLDDKIETAYEAGQEQSKRAFGGCSYCYGKGYSTQLEHYSGRGEADMGQGDVVINRQAPYYLPCSCDRGKQFEEAREEAYQAGRKEENKKKIKQIEEIYVKHETEDPEINKKLFSLTQDIIKTFNQE